MKLGGLTKSRIRPQDPSKSKDLVFLSRSVPIRPSGLLIVSTLSRFTVSLELWRAGRLEDLLVIFLRPAAHGPRPRPAARGPPLGPSLKMLGGLPG